MEPKISDGWNVKEDRQPAKCKLDKQFREKTGTWELGVRLPDEIIRYGCIIFKGDLESGLILCSILTPSQRLHRGY